MSSKGLLTNNAENTIVNEPSDGTENDPECQGALLDIDRTQVEQAIHFAETFLSKLKQKP